MATFKTDTELRALKLTTEKNKVILMADSATKCLYIKISNVSKIFIYRYYGNDKKSKKIIIGNYPAISLHEARNKAHEYTTLRQQGQDPIKYLANANTQSQIITLESVANEWISKELSDNRLSPKTTSDHKKLIKMIFEFLDPNTDIKSIDRSTIISTIDKRQQHETIKGISHDRSERLFRVIRSILDFALNRAYIDKNPANDIRYQTAFKSHVKKEYPAITDPKQVKELYNAIVRYKGDFVTKQALLFGIHTALRVGTLTALRWDFIDFDKNIIIFPAQTVKLKQAFKLPLTNQTRAILEHSKKANYFINSPFVFHSILRANVCLNTETPTKALHRLGFGDFTTFHGLRKTFSTIANENIPAHKQSPQVIELCLDHRERSTVKAIYDKSERLAERMALMQWWSDYLDSLLIDDKN
ncbi:tyrosine-type recombinase/integrase [Campylobacter fetus subsp. venerealis]|uniref:tyrosine-type recombinase/integrase n=1 Tax=Campylobacter fetus TaxID=196 RepID=UPI0018E83CDE|nr:site-specific integrase [Campylobacter fetus]QQF51322.1 tyrosine-type recombinase/integrase [Campylobacter fetus subsp. venerealis]